MRHATKVAIGAFTVLMLLVAAMFWHQAQANEEAKWWVNHTYIVRRHIQLLLSGLQDTETGHFGYVLTGNKDFLEPYDNALRASTNTYKGTGSFVADSSMDQHHSIQQKLALIRKLTADNPSQQGNLDEMEEGVKKFLDFLATTIQKRERADAASTKLATVDIDSITRKRSWITCASWCASWTRRKHTY